MLVCSLFLGPLVLTVLDRYDYYCRLREYLISLKDEGGGEGDRGKGDGNSKKGRRWDASLSAFTTAFSPPWCVRQ